MLSSEDRAILDFERSWWREPGPKDQAIEFSLGLTAFAYYERLRDLVLALPGADYDPLTVRRVRRMIEAPMGGEVAI
jgi:hypothetical protein